MDSLTLTDLNRMMLSIQHESQSKAKEIKLEGILEAKSLKALKLTEERTKLSKIYNKKENEVKIDKIKKESQLRREQRMKVHELKENIVSKILEEISLKIKTVKLNETLVLNLISKIDTNNKIYVFSKIEDIPVIEKILKNKNIDYEMKDLPYEALGGIIICSHDGRNVADNSYITRLRLFKEKHMNILSVNLFKEI